MSAYVLNLGKVVGKDGVGVPSPTPADAGKVPTVTSDGSGYELKSFENNSGCTIVDLGEQEINVSSPTIVDLSEEQNQAMQRTDTIGVKVSIKDTDDASFILYVSSKNAYANSYIYSAYVPTIYIGSGSPFSIQNLVAIYNAAQRQIALCLSNEMPYIPNAGEGDLGKALVVKNIGQLEYQDLSFPTATFSTNSFGTFESPTTIELIPAQVTALQNCERLKIKYKDSTTLYLYKINKTSPPRYVNYENFSCVDFSSIAISYFFVQADYEANTLKFIKYEIPIT